jgi:hypothetical protein
MHGKQQQRAIPIKHAKTTQKMAKKTSNARKTTANLQKFRIRNPLQKMLHATERIMLHKNGSIIYLEDSFSAIIHKSSSLIVDCYTIAIQLGNVAMKISSSISTCKKRKKKKSKADFHCHIISIV